MIMSPQILREVLNYGWATQIMQCNVLLGYEKNIPTPSGQLGGKILLGIESQVSASTAMLNSDPRILIMSIAQDF